MLGRQNITCPFAHLNISVILKRVFGVLAGFWMHFIASWERAWEHNSPACTHITERQSNLWSVLEGCCALEYNRLLFSDTENSR